MNGQSVSDWKDLDHFGVINDAYNHIFTDKKKKHLKQLHFEQIIL